MQITVFTPTYNRAHLLSRLYESLHKQTFKDFEWVVVDDGSTDDTLGFIKNVQSRIGNDFPIRYFYQENGGKHRAINQGVKEAQGELFFIADSDDMLPEKSLEIVAKVYESVKDDCFFAGICGLDGTLDGKVIGSGLPNDRIDDTSIAIRFKYGLTGDMKEVFRTAILKEYPFPEIDGERFCSEMLIWNRIATKFKLRFVNQVIYLVEYQNGGMTSRIVKARMMSPIASMMTYAEQTTYAIPFMLKVKAAINYWRFRFCSDKTEKPQLPCYWAWVIPIAYLMHLKDLRQFRIER